MITRRLAAGFAAATIATLIAAETPPKITANPGAPPSDAVVLFDGTVLASWQQGAGQAPAWKLRRTTTKAHGVDRGAGCRR